jgi:HEAT repeat protein
MLEDDSERARDAAANGLRAAGESAAAARPGLRRRIREGIQPGRSRSDLWQRRSAIATIRAIGGPAREAIPDLIGLLADVWVADDSREALEAFGGGALAQHLPALAAILRDRAVRPAAKVRAARLLVAAAVYDRQAAGPLREALRLGSGREQEAAQLRRYAAEGLGKVGDADVLPDLLPLLNDADEAVRREAAAALGRIGSKDAASALARALRDASPPVRREAASALGRLKAKDEPIVEALRGAEKDADKAVRREAAAALRKIQGKRKGEE